MPRITASDKQWQAEMDLRTLIDAAKIRKDKARYAAAMKEQKVQKKALETVMEK